MLPSAGLMPPFLTCPLPYSHRHALEDMPPEDIELPPEAPAARTRDNRRRLMPPSGAAESESHHDGHKKAAVAHVTPMDPLQFVTYSGGLGECQQDSISSRHFSYPF